MFKNTDELAVKLKSSLLPTKKEERQGKTEKKTESERTSNLRDPHRDPLLIPTRGPSNRQPPNWWTFILSLLISCKLFIGFQGYQLFRGISRGNFQMQSVEICTQATSCCYGYHLRWSSLLFGGNRHMVKICTLNNFTFVLCIV